MKFTKKFVFFLIIIVAVGAIAYSFLKPKGPDYKTETVVRGSIIQEVSETGTVKKGETINLSFKNSGTVDKISVSKGDEVAAGQLLAELDTAQLEVQLKQARANLDLYRIQRDKLVNGAGAEDIALAQTAVANAQAARDNADQSLADARQGADQKLANLYDAAGDVLGSAHAKAVSAGNAVSLTQRTYFSPQGDDSIRVIEGVRRIENAAAKINGTNDYESDLKEAAALLAKIDADLADIRVVCEKEAWRDIVDEADKDAIETQRDYIIAAQAAVNSAKQNIDLQKVANDAAINSAQSAVTVAEGALQSAREQLAKLTAQPRAEDIGVLDAQIAQAQAAVDLLSLQITDSGITAPVSGQVAQVNYREGEAFLSALAGGVISIIPDDPFFIEVDIYEEDVAKVSTGDPVDIAPASSPEDSYSGKVVSIDPTGKTVNGVVYYTTKIAFDNAPTNIKPGMSADVVIVTAEAKDVLLISESALGKNAGGNYVRVLSGAEIQETAVKTGIKSKGQVQILSGVKEGDIIITE